MITGLGRIWVPPLRGNGNHKVTPSLPAGSAHHTTTVSRFAARVTPV
jgi:hypothetical protein